MNNWYNREDCIGLRRRAIDNLVNVIKLFDERGLSSPLNEHDIETVTSTSSEDSINEMFTENDLVDRVEITNEIVEYLMLQDKVNFL